MNLSLKLSEPIIDLAAHFAQINTVKDQQLLHQLEFEDHQILSVRGFTTSVSSAAATNPVKEVRQVKLHLPRQRGTSSIAPPTPSKRYVKYSATYPV